MRESTHVKLVRLGDTFSLDLAAITVKALRQIPEKERGEALAYLQDHTSLYSPCVANAIAEGLEHA